jgi:hypothetical protein
MMTAIEIAAALLILIATASIVRARRRRDVATKKNRSPDDAYVDPAYDTGASMLLNRLEDDKRRAAEDRVRNRRA